MITFGDDIELKPGVEIYVWDKDMEQPIIGKFMEYGKRGGVYVTTTGNTSWYYSNYSIEEPTYEMLKVSTLGKNPYKEQRG